MFEEDEDFEYEIRLCKTTARWWLLFVVLMAPFMFLHPLCFMIAFGVVYALVAREYDGRRWRLDASYLIYPLVGIPLCLALIGALVGEQWQRLLCVSFLSALHLSWVKTGIDWAKER